MTDIEQRMGEIVIDFEKYPDADNSDLSAEADQLYVKRVRLLTESDHLTNDVDPVLIEGRQFTEELDLLVAELALIFEKLDN